VTPLRATLGAIALLMAAAPACAAARQGDPILRDKRLWTTINVCDTVGHPDSIGIRGSMPGDGDKGEVMFMRFGVQLFDAADARWHNLDGADSGFVEVGSARKARQSGNTFTITPPRPGAAPYLLRGAVSFEWREAGQVVRHTRRSTAAAHPNTAGSDPVGFSSATCTIT
jgi:hypothetical protein